MLKTYDPTKNSTLLKGTLTRDFRPLICFYRTNSPWPLVHWLKTFRMWLRIPKLFHKVDCRAVSMTPWCQWYRCQWYLPTLLNIFANDPKHCFLLLFFLLRGNLTRLHIRQQCQWHRYDSTVVPLTPPAMTCTAVTAYSTFKWNFSHKKYIGKCPTLYQKYKLILVTKFNYNNIFQDKWHFDRGKTPKVPKVPNLHVYFQITFLCAFCH
jgi:hypothetical protein